MFWARVIRNKETGSEKQLVDFKVRLYTNLQEPLSVTPIHGLHCHRTANDAYKNKVPDCHSARLFRVLEHWLGRNWVCAKWRNVGIQYCCMLKLSGAHNKGRACRSKFRKEVKKFYIGNNLNKVPVHR